MGKDTAATFAPSELRRDISVWGSYMWGYADIGADIYTALGIVALAALGLTPLAFLLAASTSPSGGSVTPSACLVVQPSCSTTSSISPCLR